MIWSMVMFYIVIIIIIIIIIIIMVIIVIIVVREACCQSEGADTYERAVGAVRRGTPVPNPQIRGNHLSNTTCLTQVFFKSCEERSKL